MAHEILISLSFFFLLLLVCSMLPSNLKFHEPLVYIIII